MSICTYFETRTHRFCRKTEARKVYLRGKDQDFVKTLWINFVLLTNNFLVMLINSNFSKNAKKSRCIGFMYTD